MGPTSPDRLAEIGGVISPDAIKTPNLTGPRTRRGLFGLAGRATAAASLATLLGGAIVAFAEGTLGPGAGGEEPKTEPAGFKTEDGYAWVDGKAVIISTPLAPVDFDRLITEPLKDLQTGQPREGQFSQHTETRTYLDLAQADRLVIVEDSTLPERWGKNEGVYAVTLDRKSPRNNPNMAFMYFQTILRPTDDPKYPNDIMIRVFKNLNCPLPETADGEVPQVYGDFYGSIAGHLAQVAFVFKDANPHTKFSSVGFNADTPQSKLSYNLDYTLPFAIAA